MRHRIPVKCETCGQDITLRVSIGHENSQEHVITCPNCSEEIVLELELFPEINKINISKLENAKFMNHESANSIIVNISPNFPISNDMLHKDYVAPDMMELIKLLENNGTINNIKQIFPSGSAVDMTLMAGKKYNMTSQWEKIKKCWSLYKNNKQELLERYIPNNDSYKNPITKKKDFKFLLFSFISNFYQEDKIAKIMEYSKEANDTFPNEYLKFLKYISENIFEKCLNSFYGIFIKFFDNYSEFGQLEIAAMNNLNIDNNYNVTSFDFYKTDMFYGSAYEQFTNFIDILALIFNVHEGRKFNTFLSMDYEKYKSLDKANKTNPFKEVPELYSVCEILYSGLRNASHHGDIRFDSVAHIVEYTYGKEKQHTETMTYASYLRNCYDMFISCCILINVIILHKFSYEVLSN